MTADLAVFKQVLNMQEPDLDVVERGMKPSLSCFLPSFSLEKKKIEVLMENDPLLFLLIVPFNSLLITSTVVQVDSPPH